VYRAWLRVDETDGETDLEDDETRRVWPPRPPHGPADRGIQGDARFGRAERLAGCVKPAAL